jgi:hypothetical protein
MKRTSSIGMLGASFVALVAATAMTPAAAQQIAIDPNDIGGVVRSAKGPEAGVWVIAETRDLPTKYVKIVVTDDQGRYVLPDLPRGTYDIWVRGYGLVDSMKTKSTPGKNLNLTAIVAPNRTAAAQVYPAIYWYAMLKVPAVNLFPGTGANGNGMPTALRDQGQWLRFLKTDGCIHCHQIGDLSTRTFPHSFGTFNTSAEAWERRLQSGQAGRNMMDELGKFDVQRQLAALADWSDRIAKGELPKTDPARPTGRSRDVVVTEWDWANEHIYLHDTIATDKRTPTINSNGLIYGAPEASSDLVPWLDPIDNKAGFIKSEYRDPKTPSTADQPMLASSPYWGDQKIWDSHTNIHNPMFDEKGRLWLTARIRPAMAQPEYCKAGSNHPSAMAYPKNTANRQVEVYDPKTQKIDMIDLCFNTHHLQFDKDNVLWFSAGGNYDVIGWLDTKKWEATKDEASSQGWSPFVLDTNGNGKRDAGWTEPDAPLDPNKDKRIIAGLYGVGPNPVDGSIWGSVTGFPGGVVRFDPKTQLTEFYQFPYKNSKAPVNGFSPRGSDISSEGVLWSVLSSGHVASFDRRLCKGKLNGPAAADGQNVCPEGFRLYQMPGPEFDVPAGTIGASAEAPYYVWVDQHNILGMGKDVPIATASQSDGLAALVDGKWVALHVPYPMSFYPKNLDGRIDDANGGWKGRGIWSVYSGRSQPHIEGGKGNTSKVVKVQMRNNPLEK